MRNIEFGVYFIPQADSEFYTTGSEIIGYDIRNRTSIASNQIGKVHISDKWRGSSRKFGLHMTLTDVVTIDVNQLPEVVNHVRNIFQRSDTKQEIEIRCESVRVIDSRKSVIGINVEKTDQLQSLHESLVEVQKRGSSSYYTRKILIDSGWEHSLTKEQRENIDKYLSPYILGEFMPHFTLLDPVDDQSNVQQIAEEIDKTLNLPFSLVLQRLSVVTRRQMDGHFFINEEITSQ